MASKRDGSCSDDEGVYTQWWDGRVSSAAVYAVSFLVPEAIDVLAVLAFTSQSQTSASRGDRSQSEP